MISDPLDLRAVESFLADVVPVAVLAATPQDAAFHAEGDVWTHTQLALAALAALPAFAALPPLARSIVATAVALHDIGQPSTTREEGGKLTSRGHSARGEHLARAALWRQGVPFGIREHVCALIHRHQVPFFGITRPDPERLAIELSLVTRNDWLALVAEADGRGRRCLDPADQVRIIEHCALWAEHCRELGILDRPRRFASAHTRQVWLEARDRPGASRQPDVLAHDDTTCEVILMSGLPASGKDTWLAAQRPGWPVVSLDELRDELDVDPADGGDQARVVALARERARAYLRDGRSFAWNATNLSASLRAQLLGLVRDYRARTHVVYVETTAAEQHTRNRARAQPVPAKVIDRMLQRWSVPAPTEAHEVTYVVAGAPGWPIQA
ncbi:MAG: AAA family ATPase [Proteobacteria bacterium]|nr:AAA family ATPase [Pseudomonadota bacterium]